MTKILITNAYSWLNKGDSGIVMGMVKTLNEVFDNPDITVLSFTPSTDTKNYPIHLNFLPDPLDVTYDSQSQFNKIRVPLTAPIMALQAKTDTSFLREEIADAYSSADLVLSCGGGFLGGYSPASLVHVFSIYLATLYDKPTVIYAQSINKFGNPVVKYPTEYALNKTDLIMPREEVSEAYARKLGLKPRIERIPDAAFMLDPDEEIDPERELRNHGVPDAERVIGMTVRKWSFPDSDSPDQKLDNYKSAVQDAISHLTADGETEVVLFPQVIFAPHDDDRKISKDIRDACPTAAQDHLTVLESNYTPPELISLIGACDFFVGTRMHSNIFATRAGVPTVAISYQAKTNGIMKMLGLDGWWVDISEITSNNLVGLIERGLSNRDEIQAAIDQRVPELRAEIRSKSEQLVELAE